MGRTSPHGRQLYDRLEKPVNPKEARARTRGTPIGVGAKWLRCKSRISHLSEVPLAHSLPTQTGRTRCDVWHGRHEQPYVRDSANSGEAIDTSHPAVEADLDPEPLSCHACVARYSFAAPLGNMCIRSDLHKWLGGIWRRPLPIHLIASPRKNVDPDLTCSHWTSHGLKLYGSSKVSPLP